MLLTNPYTGCVVDAPEEQAERLMAHGFKPADKPEAPKRRAPKRAKTTKEQ
jgi:hypothetical protein